MGRSFIVLAAVAASITLGCTDSRTEAGADSGAGADADGSPGSADARPGAPDARPEDPALEPRNGYPGDFPELIDSGGFGAGVAIQGFGGDTSVGRSGNRAQLSRRPVILLHGNGTNITNDNFGMTHIRDMLLADGYVDAEIWAPSYLGQTIFLAETPTPHRTNIDDVRRFIDAVIEYLGVDQVDVVGHSLGCGLINGYLRGLQPDGTFDTDAHRYDRIGTVVCLGAALYGTGSGSLFDPEFNVDGQWVAQSLQWDGVEDATVNGASATADMIAPDQGTIPGGRAFRASSATDDGSRRIYYVALWANDDIVDSNLENACGLQGADLNRGFDLPDSLPGVITAELARHGHLLRNQGVFDAFAPFLDR